MEARLGFAIDSSQAKAAVIDLDQLTDSAGKAGTASEKMGSSGKKASEALSEIATNMRATNALLVQLVQNSAQGNAALDKLTLSADKATDALAKIGTGGGSGGNRPIPPMTDDVDKLRAALDRFSQSGDSVTRLQAKIAEGERLIAEAQGKGLAVPEGAMASLANYREKLAEATGAANDNTKATALSGNQIAELGHITRSVAGTMLYGGSALQAFGYEANRIASVLTIGPSGVGGTLRAMGAAAKGAASAVLGIVGVVPLVGIALAGLGAAAVYEFGNFNRSAKASEDILREFKDFIDEVGESSKESADRLRELLKTPASFAAEQADAARLATDATDKLAESMRNALNASRAQVVTGSSDGIFPSIREFLTGANSLRSGFTEASRAVDDTRAHISDLIENLGSGKESASQVYDELSTLRTAQTTPASLYSTIDALSAIIKEAATARSQLDALGNYQNVDGTAIKGARPGTSADISATENLHARLGDFDTEGLTKKLQDQAKQLEHAARAPATHLSSAERAAASAAKSYDKLVQSGENYISQQEAARASLGLTTQAASTLQHQQELLNRAASEGLKLTPAQTQQLKDLGASMGAAEAATEKARETMDFARDATKGFLSSFTNAIEQGKNLWQSFGDAASSVLDKVISKIEDNLTNALLGVGNSGSGGGGNWLTSIFGGLFGGGGSSFVQTPGAGLFANGGVFGPGGLHAFATGGVVTRPTLFPFANGTGLMGEAGPEAIMPLKRGPGGRLGVSLHGAANQNAQPQPVNINVNVEGANGDQHVIDLVHQGVASGLGAYRNSQTFTQDVARGSANAKSQRFARRGA